MHSPWFLVRWVWKYCRISLKAVSYTHLLAALLTNLNENDILFVDEIHRLNRAVEEVLYPAMEDYAIDIIIGKGPSANSILSLIHICTLLEVISAEPPKIFFDGFGMELPEGAYREYPKCDLLYDLP